MEKLVRGIIDFRRRVLPTCRDKFEELAKGQYPDTLFITCSDSRVAPNWFASTDPGDLFVVRNVGNILPACGESGVTTGDVSEFAAVEFALQNLNVSHIIVCGHSECGAMNAVVGKPDLQSFPHLKSWLRNADAGFRKLSQGLTFNSSLSRVNQLSQINVLEQIQNLKTYPLIQKKLEQKKLQLHGWWFDIAKADVYQFDESVNKFVLIAE